MSAQRVSEDKYEANKPQILSDEDKNRTVPWTQNSDPGAFNRSRLNDKARLHLRAMARFCLWATPLFDLGHVKLREKLIEFDLLISKRFLLSRNSEGLPRIEFQASEFAWVREIPWSQAGVHFKTKTLYLVAKPEQPLSLLYFSIPIDLIEKLEIFKAKRYLELTQAQYVGSITEPEVIRIELSELTDGFATKKKQKYKM